MSLTRRQSAPLAAILAALLALVSADHLDDRIAASEDIVRDLQRRATELYGDRRGVVAGCRCSVHSCANVFEDSLACTTALGLSEACSACGVEGRMLDMERSTILTPPGADPNNLNPDIIESLCTFEPLDEGFVEHGPNGSYTWSYIGTTTGTFRVWPGEPRARGLQNEKHDEALGNCKQYDPRTRPWFIAASSGPKDVVIILDASGSMRRSIAPGAAERWEIAAGAVNRLLGTFGISDFVSIVTFNSRASALGMATTMLRANDSNIEMLRDTLTLITPENGTDFRAGFNVGFDILINSTLIARSTDLTPTSQCTKVILFLTDGEDCTLSANHTCAFGESKATKRGMSDPDLVLDYIEERQSELEAVGSTRAHIFTFSMTSGADDKLPKMIACENEGSWSAIEEHDDPLIKFLDYTRFFAWGRRGLDVIWSNFYMDDAGLGNLTTAAMPVYSPDTAEGVPGLLVGVVGKDVLVSQLDQDDQNFRVVFDRIIERTSVCRKNKLDICQLQVLRGEEAECPDMLPDAPCYYLDDEERYYVTDPDQHLPFELAADACVAFGGHLAEIDTETEHSLLASLATRAGSWIGLQKNETGFRWLQSGVSVPSPEESFKGQGGQEPTGRRRRKGIQGSDLWAIHTDGDNDCGAIDRRGRRNGVRDVDCSIEMAFICEFGPESAPELCQGRDTLRVDRRYDPTIPSLEDCRDFEIALVASTKVVEATMDLSSDDALCPLGDEPKATEAVQCCC